MGGRRVGLGRRREAALPVAPPVAAALAAVLLTSALLAGAAGCASGPGAPPRAAGSAHEATVTARSASAGGASAETTPPRPAVVPYTGPPIVFAVIGDYGMNDKAEASVAKLVKSWNPEFIITTGDDYYNEAGGTGAEQYDRSTARYYGRWVEGHGAANNAFFPTLGNHDYTDADPGPQTYLDYFTLPGTGLTSSSDNERYYDFVKGPIHFFALNSNPQEPGDFWPTGAQGAWLRRQMWRSDSPFNVVYDHHPPYSSDKKHGSLYQLRWPYSEWGADVMISGHAHTYERIVRDDMVYFVNGIGGAPRYGFGPTVEGSQVRYDKNWGAQKVTATGSTLLFESYSVKGKLIDRWEVARKR